MAEHSTSVLIENSIQIAWDFLERSGEIGDPVIASLPLRQHRADGPARGEESVTALAAERDVAEIVVAPKIYYPRQTSSNSFAWVSQSAAHIVPAERRGFGQPSCTIRPSRR